MKEPVKYTGERELLTIRRRKVYPGFVPSVPLLQRRESERTSQIFHNGDELECGPLNPDNNAETIMFQSDPSLRIKLAKLRQAKKQVQAEIKELRQKISKHEYARVVRRHTVMTRGWIAVRPPKFRQEPSKPVFDWVPHWQHTELVSEEEWLKRMLQLTTLRVQQREDYKRRLAAWVAHPEWERRPYRYWREGLFWIRKTIFPAGYFGFTKVPVKEFKVYPIRRWKLIRADWSRRLNSIRPRLTKLQKRYDQIKAEMAVLYYHTESKPMCYSQDVELAPINRQAGRRVMELDGFPSQGLVDDGYLLGGTSVHQWSYAGFAIKASLQPLEDWNAPPWPIPEPTLECPGRIELRLPAPCRMWEYNSHISGHFTVRDDYSLTNYTSQFDDAVGVRVEVLDDIKRLEDDLEDRLRSARLALLNLRLGRDVIEFNPFRSLLEQKDVPQTFRTGREFMRFAQGSLGQEYYEVITSSGHRTLLTRKSMSSAQRSILLGSSRHSKAALRAAGLTKATRQVVTKRTGLRVLAGLYLAYKFAIAPTQSDISTVLDKGRNYVMTCRRGLDQLIRKKGLHFWESRSLYRTFKVGDPAMLAQKSRKRLIDVSIPVTSTLEVPWSLEIPDDHLRLWIQGDVPSGLVQSEHGPVYEASGLPLWFPTPVKHGENRFEYLNGIWRHNLDTIVAAIPERYRAGLVSVRQLLRGKLYARFRARELMRGLGDGSIRDKIAWANLYKTTWDLLPCSFVLEWFTNLGEVATATNDLVNAMVSGLNTSKKTWASLSSTAFANEPVFPELDIAITARPTRFRRLWLDPFPELFYALSVHDFASCFEGVVKLNCNLPQTARLLRNTAIRTSVRRVVDTALDTPRVRLRVSITPPQAGSLAAMLLSGG